MAGLLDRFGYPLVAVFVGIESSGIPFPGETMLVTTAVYAGTGHLSIAGVIVAGALSAIIGDNLGYTAGRYGGRALVTRYGRYVRLRSEHLAYAERFFEKYGDKTVFLGRFAAVLRAWSAFLAGTNRMRWPKFLFFNAAGGILWAIVFVIDVLGIGGVVLTVIVVTVGLVVSRPRRSAHERSMEATPSPDRDGRSS